MAVNKFGVGLKSTMNNLETEQEFFDFDGKRLSNIGYPREENDCVTRNFINSNNINIVKNFNEQILKLRNEISVDIAKTNDFLYSKIKEIEEYLYSKDDVDVVNLP